MQIVIKKKGYRIVPVIALAVLALVVGVMNVSATPINGANFEIDGNTAQTACTTPSKTAPAHNDDWETIIPSGTGVLGSFTNANYGPCLGPTGTLIADGFNSSNETNFFSPAGKIGDPSKWLIKGGSIGPSQNDLTNVTIFQQQPNQSFNGDSFLGMSLERTKKEGTFSLYYEFNQKAWDGQPGTLVRTKGDILVGFALGGNPTDAQKDLVVQIVVFDPTAAPTCGAPYVAFFGGSFCILAQGPADVTFGGNSKATMNGTDFPAPPWKSVDDKGKQRTTIPAFMFAEGLLDLTELNLTPGCGGFGGAFAYTVSSLSFTADMKDLAGPISFPISCGLSGHKYEDLNANGVIDDNGNGTVEASEATLLSGWTIKLYKGSTFATATLCTVALCGVAGTTTTDANGFYHYDGLNDGTYFVQEDCTGQTNYIQSVPTPTAFTTAACGSGVIGPIAINVNNPNSTNNDFANYRNGTKSGVKFKDLDGDGVKDSGEPGLQGVTINISGTDGGGNAVNVDKTTDATGAYSFSVRPGTYTVCETVPSGFIQTYPKSSTTPPTGETIVTCTNGTQGYSLTLQSAGSQASNDFGNAQGSLRWLKVAKNASSTVLCPGSTTVHCSPFGGASFSIDKNPHDGTVGAFAVTDCTTALCSSTGEDKDPDAGEICIDNVKLSVSFTVTETATNNVNYLPDTTSPPPSGSASSSRCSDRAATSSDLGPFVNTPLSAIEMKFDSVAGSGVTKASIVCTGQTADTSTTNPGDNAGENLTPDPAFDDTNEIFTSLVPGTYNCQVVIDP